MTKYLSLISKGPKPKLFYLLGSDSKTQHINEKIQVIVALKQIYLL